MNKVKINGKKQILLGILVVVFILMFGSWLSINIPRYGSMEVSIISLSDALGYLTTMGSYMDSTVYGTIKLINIGMWGIFVTILGVIATPFYKVLKNPSNDLTISIASFIVPMSYSLVFILVIMLLNQVISNEFGGALPDIINIGMKPYFIVILCSVGIYVKYNVNEDQIKIKGLNSDTLKNMDTDALKEKSSEALNNVMNKVKKVSNNSFSGSNTFPTTVHYQGLKTHVTSVQLKKGSSTEIKIVIADYNGQYSNILAIKLDVELISAFRESTHIKDVPFIDFEISINDNIKRYTSKYVKINLDEGVVDTTREIKPYINQLVIDDEIINVKDMYRPFVYANNKEKIFAIRDKYGFDVVTEQVIKKDEWGCVCGHVNMINNSSCEDCNRVKD